MRKYQKWTCSTGHFGIKPSIFSSPNWGHSQVTPFPPIFFIVPSPKKNIKSTGSVHPNGPKSMQSPASPFPPAAPPPPFNWLPGSPGDSIFTLTACARLESAAEFPSVVKPPLQSMVFFLVRWRIGCVPLRCELS